MVDQIPDIQKGTSEFYRVDRTMPGVILRHDISEDELEALCNMKRGPLFEGKWTSFGLFVGGLPQTMQAIFNAYIKEGVKTPISLWDLTAVAIVAISIALFFVLQFVVKDAQESADKLRETIKGRPKLTVHRGEAKAN